VVKLIFSERMERDADLGPQNTHMRREENKIRDLFLTNPSSEELLVLTSSSFILLTS
jgi:hypothetical protein